MLLSVHATVGAIIGQNVSTAILAFVLAFISHFVLDIFPHGDEALVKAYRGNFKNRGMIYLIIFDVATTAILIPLLFLTQKVNFMPTVIWGIIGGVIPDFFVGIYEITHKHFRRTHKLHAWLHNILGHQIGGRTKLNMSLKFGILIQIILIYLILS